MAHACLIMLRSLQRLGPDKVRLTALEMHRYEGKRSPELQMHLRRRDAVLASLRCTIAQLRCHDASVSRLTAMAMPLLVEQLLDHWHP